MIQYPHNSKYEVNVMKVNVLGQPEIVMSSNDSRHNYFGWPTVARLQDGRIAVTASGFRRRHVCPFGKTVIAYSSDEGKTYTAPVPVIDTCLDDRDGGICPFGEHGFIVTSFNNTTAFQRENAKDDYDLAYLDAVDPKQEEKDLGFNFRITKDGGKKFGPILKSPVTSPHGPTVLKDGTIVWVGRTFSITKEPNAEDCIKAYKMDEDGNMTFLGRLPDMVGEADSLACEPHAFQADDGTLICQVRFHRNGPWATGMFTLYQTESKDGGVTWSEPHYVVGQFGGAPAHIMRHSSGVLISTYTQRTKPFVVKAMFSKDNGRSWDTEHVLYTNGYTPDLGYSSTVELKDGSLLTVFYGHPDGKNTPAVIMQQRWTIEE